MNETNQPLGKVEIDMQEIHELSLDILTFLEEEGCNISQGVAVCGMSIGRLLSNKAMSADEEMAFIQAVVEFGATYFTGGPLN